MGIYDKLWLESNYSRSIVHIPYTLVYNKLMPKSALKLAIHLDLLKPQSNPEKLLVRSVHWVLSTGRYLLVFVEALVLIAFIVRFKLDGDLASKKEAIEQQISYIEALKDYEILIRETQFKLSTIGAAKTNLVDYPAIFKKIADQTPTGVKITNLNLGKKIDQANIQINASAKSNNDVTSFLAGLKEEDQTFSDVNLTSIGLDQGVISFTITASNKSEGSKGASL